MDKLLKNILRIKDGKGITDTEIHLSDLKSSDMSNFGPPKEDNPNFFVIGSVFGLIIKHYRVK